MTFIERAIAKLGIVGVLVIILTCSLLMNLWQFSRAAKASSRCDARIAELQASAAKIEQRRELAGQEIARETRESAQEAQNATITETQERAERVRTIIRTVEIPANCPVALPDSVRREISQATRAANR